MENKYTTLEPEGVYHVYNRANGGERIFRYEENYAFFLKQYTKYIPPLVDTFCYCLMPNHFHFLIQIKNEQALKEQLKLPKKQQDQPKFQTLADLYGLAISKQFENFFSSYTQAFNKMYHRKGSLFMKSYKRIKVDNETYLKKLVHYIHFNPLEAAMVKSPIDWKFSSYQAILSSKQSLVNRNHVIELFEDEQNFIYCHKTLPDKSGIA